jgi:hypothetical protein
MIRRLLCIVACVAVPAAAHDFWIEPSTFRPGVGKTFTVSLLVGQDFTGDVVPRSAQLIESFTLRDAGGEHAINGFENQDPAGYVRIDRPGLAIIGYRSKANPLELSAEKFNEFVRQEDLRIPPATQPHREHFFRYAKSIVVCGPASAGRPPEGGPHTFGYRFEIVPETLDGHVRIFFEGKPLANALVTAIHRDDPSARMSARSDDSGRVRFALPKTGVWLIKSVHVIQNGGEWESLWASLTFER